MIRINVILIDLILDLILNEKVPISYLIGSYGLRWAVFPPRASRRRRESPQRRSARKVLPAQEALAHVGGPYERSVRLSICLSACLSYV